MAASDGDGPATTDLICGCFHFQDERGARLLAALPALIHAKAGTTAGSPWLAQTVELLAAEATAERPGTTTVVNRLCDALFVYLLRGYLAALPAQDSSLLQGLADPQIGAALHLIHQDPGKPWTVASIAAAVGMSRSAFAARFSQLVGEPPMRYLQRWRLHEAAVALRGAGARNLPEVAASAGYDSVAAFSKAFKRTIGSAPGAYRRAMVRAPG